jgi:hypothetical protein
MKAEDMLDVLAELFALRGVPNLRTASEWKSTPCSLQRRPISAMGWPIPAASSRAQPQRCKGVEGLFKRQGLRIWRQTMDGEWLAAADFLQLFFALASRLPPTLPRGQQGRTPHPAPSSLASRLIILKRNPRRSAISSYVLGATGSLDRLSYPNVRMISAARFMSRSA